MLALSLVIDSQKAISSSKIAASSLSIPIERTHEFWPKELRVTAALYLSLSFSCSLPPLSLTPRVWNHSEVVLVLSPPTSHLLNEPSIDRRHFAVSRFPSHLATAPALPAFRSPLFSPAVLPLSPVVRLTSSRYWLKSVQKFLLHTEKRDPTRQTIADLGICEQQIEVA